MVGIELPAMGLHATEVGQDVVVAPAAAARLRPQVEIPRVPAHEAHAVDRGGAAQDPPARMGDAPAVEEGLGLGREGPVVARALQRIGHGRGHLDAPVAVLRPGLQEQDPHRRIGREPVGDDATGRAGADDHEVELACYAHLDRCPPKALRWLDVCIQVCKPALQQGAGCRPPAARKDGSHDHVEGSRTASAAPRRPRRRPGRAGGALSGPAGPCEGQRAAHPGLGGLCRRPVGQEVRTGAGRGVQDHLCRLGRRDVRQDGGLEGPGLRRGQLRHLGLRPVPQFLAAAAGGDGQDPQRRQHRPGVPRRRRGDARAASSMACRSPGAPCRWSTARMRFRRHPRAGRSCGIRSTRSR